MAKKLSSNDLWGDKTHRALQETAPIDVDNLGTPEAQKVSHAYSKNGYWLSEMYLYMPSIRPALKKVVQQLKAKKRDPNSFLGLMFNNKPFEVGDVTIWNEAANNENQFILDWSSNHGFGLFTFFRRESGHVVCSTECMKHTTVEKVLRTYIDRGGEWPVMMQGYASVDDFLSGVVFIP